MGQNTNYVTNEWTLPVHMTYVWQTDIQTHIYKYRCSGGQTDIKHTVINTNVFHVTVTHYDRHTYKHTFINTDMFQVTVTHYDASKSSGVEGGSGLVATPTHTETIIVTPPKVRGIFCWKEEEKWTFWVEKEKFCNLLSSWWMLMKHEAASQYYQTNFTFLLIWLDFGKVQKVSAILR